MIVTNIKHNSIQNSVKYQKSHFGLLVNKYSKIINQSSARVEVHSLTSQVTPLIFCVVSVGREIIIM